MKHMQKNPSINPFHSQLSEPDDEASSNWPRKAIFIASKWGNLPSYTPRRYLGNTLDQLRDYCESSTIHGPAYFPSDNLLRRTVWIFAVGVCAFFAVGLIRDSFQDWATGQVLTTIGDDSVPVQELQVL